MSTIVDELEKIHQEKASGTLVIADPKKRMAHINLLNGAIVGLSFGNKSGMEVLQIIREIEITWFQFIKGSSNRAVTASHTQLPSTLDIIGLLKDSSSEVSAPLETGKILTPESISQQTLAILKATLTDFMGPVAPMICKKILRQTQDLNLAIELIAREIPNIQQGIEFKSRVRQQLP